jgi:hypothetical protein
MLPTEMRYCEKYLPTNIVEQCFHKAKYSFVDKVLTGNGFTTGFLEIRPTNTNQSNIIIVPNKQVVISKQQKQLDTLKYGTDDEKKKIKNIGFFYGDISSDKLEFGKFDTMMFVIDSFLNYSKQIEANKQLIDKILIDEVHSMIIQSPFRHRLVGFLEYIQQNFTSSKIVSVTATPMLFNKVDIKLISDTLNERDINITSSQTSTLKRIKNDLKNGENVVVALQDVRLLKKLANEEGILDANLKIGETLYRKVVEAVVLNLNKESNLTIISSAGFEGFDIENGINKVYVFEDRAFDYQTFYSQNIVQIIGRSRKGVSYIEWCRMPFANRTNILSKEDMLKKANSDKISFEKKMTDKNYKYIPKYFNTNQDIKLGLITDLTLDHTKYDLDKELIDTDLKGLDNTYKEFFKERGFTLVYLNEGHKRLNLRNVSHKTAFKNLKLNSKIIKRYSLMSGLSLNLWKQDKTEQYIRAFEIYFRRKYWELDQLPFGEDFQLIDHATHDTINENLDTLKDELTAYRIITDEKELNTACKLICKQSIEKKLKTVNRKSKEFESWKVDLINNIKDRYIRLVMGFSQKKIKLPKKIRNSRDYNLLTEVSMPLIDAVSELFDTEAYEIDIISCNIRIIYAICGLKLPTGFYGENKVNKKRINALLNRLSIDFPTKEKWNIQNYKNKRIGEMRNLGFDEKVITFLMETFWYDSTDAVFNFCAYHEKNIIEKLRSEIDKGKYKGMVRRHDSIIYFGDISEDQLDTIIDFEYLGQYGWFRDYDIIKQYGSVLNENVLTEKGEELLLKQDEELTEIYQF